MVAARIVEWARAQPDKTALVHNGVALKYLAFARAIEAARRFFLSHELPPCGVAVVHIHHSAEAWIATLALRRLGLDALCLNAPDAVEKLELAKLPDIAAFVVSGSEPRARFAGARNLAPTIVLPAAIYHDAAAVADRSHDEPPFGGQILYTSGTTGTYKKVLMRGDGDEHRNLRLATGIGFERASIYNVSNFGLWTALGHKMASAVWQVGGTVILDQRPDWADHFFDHGVNIGSLTPFMVPKLLARHETAHPRAAAMRVTIGGGFVSSAMMESVRTRIAAQIRMFYGSTETDSFMTLLYPDDGDLDGYTPSPGSRVEIVDEDDRICAAGEPGYLRFPRIDSDADGYLGDAETSAKMFRRGCFYPGDMAVRREDGRIRILGRVDDVLNVRGVKIAVAPLEQSVQRLLGVANVCVFGGLSARGGEDLVVAIEAQQVAKADLERIATRFPEFRQFENVSFKVIKEFPRTDVGMQKIDRRRLREIVWDKP